jgi:hypothetical protein
MRILRKDWELLNRIAWNILNLKIEDDISYLNLESSTDTFKVLGRLNAPVFVHILISSLCWTINSIRPETNEPDIIKIANRILLIMREIKKRRPNWRFQFCPNSPLSSKDILKGSKSNQKYFSKINKLKNFLIINQILSQIRVNEGYEENSHLFEALKGTKRKRGDSKLKWLFFHKIPELPNLIEYK